MKSIYDDILSLTNKQPLWWDENGVPRFKEHHPNCCPDIYANEVVFLEIACQACLRRLYVQLSANRLDYARFVADMDIDQQKAFAASHDGIFAHEVERIKKGQCEIPGLFHYGDPPAHDSPNSNAYCHIGCTMNVYDLRICEFWRRGKVGWERVGAYEIELEKI